MAAEEVPEPLRRASANPRKTPQQLVPFGPFDRFFCGGRAPLITKIDYREKKVGTNLFQPLYRSVVPRNHSGVAMGEEWLLFLQVLKIIFVFFFF